ncbi:hypothetical protein H5400_24265 [Rhodococcus wratislaviensis]|nr:MULTISPECIES: hypothetical protein [unclassified Rhodococcus (in: high G+C Gram-positive bacteria)]MBC2641936.1 hypothetical protein [Rhodococcus sp. 3A]MBC2893323.1 hypothetical protein [Rhodococcus sp. 4CII]
MTLTYADFQAQTCWAAGLLRTAGIGIDDRVGLSMLPNNCRFQARCHL